MIRSASIAVLLAGLVIRAIFLGRRPSPRDALRNTGVKISDRTWQTTPPIGFVDANSCGGCHERELKLWMGSHHQLAMQPATDSTVLGDFKGASFVHGGVTSRFFRRDHSIRIPRTDLSSKLGTPNAYYQCHSNRSARWAAEAVEKWYRHTSSGYQKFAEVLRAGEIRAPGAADSFKVLAADLQQPAIARASAVALMAPYAERLGPNSIRAP